MAAILRNAIRQALTQQLKGQAVSSSSLGIPGHLPQVNCFCRSTNYGKLLLAAAPVKPNTLI